MRRNVLICIGASLITVNDDDVSDDDCIGCALPCPPDHRAVSQCSLDTCESGVTPPRVISSAATTWKEAAGSNSDDRSTSASEDSLRCSPGPKRCSSLRRI